MLTAYKAWMEIDSGLTMHSLTVLWLGIDSGSEKPMDRNAIVWAKLVTEWRGLPGATSNWAATTHIREVSKPYRTCSMVPVGAATRKTAR